MNKKLAQLPKFTALQTEEIIRKTVNILAKPEDRDFFSGILQIYAYESKSSAEFSAFIAGLLKAHFE